ncbi:MAG: FixH family protein [Pirellula sp.]
MSTASKITERRAARFWTSFILGLMAINLGVAAMAIWMAVGDPSFRPMPEYGEHAIDWQARKNLQSRSDALNWKTNVERSAIPQGIVVQLVDANGDPVVGCTGSIHAYHFTRANAHQKVKVAPVADRPGCYIAPMDVSLDGRWQVTIELERAPDEKFFLDRTMEWSKT